MDHRKPHTRVRSIPHLPGCRLERRGSPLRPFPPRGGGSLSHRFAASLSRGATRLSEFGLFHEARLITSAPTVFGNRWQFRMARTSPTPRPTNGLQVLASPEVGHVSSHRSWQLVAVSNGPRVPDPRPTPACKSLSLAEVGQFCSTPSGMASPSGNKNFRPPPARIARQERCKTERLVREQD